MKRHKLSSICLDYIYSPLLVATDSKKERVTTGSSDLLPAKKTFF